MEFRTADAHGGAVTTIQLECEVSDDAGAPKLRLVVNTRDKLAEVCAEQLSGPGHRVRVVGALAAGDNGVPFVEASHVEFSSPTGEPNQE